MYVYRFRLTGVLLIFLEELRDLVANFALWHLDIILGVTAFGHEGEEAVVSDVELRSLSGPGRLLFLERGSYKLVFATSDVGDLHVVGGWGQIFELLVGEDVESSKMDLCVTVFASLGGGHFDDLAGTTLDDNEAVLSQGGTLHRVGSRGTGIGTLKGVLML